MIEVRIDKWLWAVRLFKTRTLAAEACRAGRVKIAGQNVKPARGVKVDEVISARTGAVTRTVKVLGLLDRRVGASQVDRFMEDRTPPEELDKQRENRVPPVFWRPKGAGRPTKRERRTLMRLRPKRGQVQPGANIPLFRHD